jgi:hypothetical protein
VHDLERNQSNQLDDPPGRHVPDGRQLFKRGRPFGRRVRPSSGERDPDLSRLKDAEIELEARREDLRDQRQARRQKAEDGRFDNTQQAVLLGLLIFGAVGAMVAVVIGSIHKDGDVARAGLLALCTISGGVVYRLHTITSSGRRQ